MDSNNNSPASWVDRIFKFGPWALLVFIGVGAVPGIPSPFDKLAQAIEKHDTAVAQHQKETLKLLRAICYRLPAWTSPKTSCE